MPVITILAKQLWLTKNYMKELFNSVKNNLGHHFVKDVATLQVGTIIGTILAFASALVMARVFQPELYGQYILIFSLVGLVGLFMNWGEEGAATILLSEAYNRKDKKEVLNIIAYYFKVFLIIICSIGLLALIFAPFLARILYHQEIIGHWSRVIFLTNFILAGYSFLLLIFKVVRKIKQYTILENLNKFIISLAIILAIISGLGVWGAVYVQLLVACLLFILGFFWYKNFQRKETLLPTWQEIVKAIFKIKIKKYFKFGFQIAIDKNIINLRGLLPILLLGYFLASSEVAFYRIAFSYLALTTLLTSPIANLLNVQFPKTKIYGTEQLKKRFIQTSIVSGVISVFSCLIFVILAPFLVELFYGPEYLSAIPLIYILALNFSFLGFGLGLGSIFKTINKVKYSIIANGVILMFSLYPAWFLVQRYSSAGIAWWVGVTYLITLIVDFAMLNIFLKKDHLAKQ